MNNIFSFEEYLVEKKKWEKIDIENHNNPKDGSVKIITTKGEDISDSDKEEITDILTDTNTIIDSVTGGCNVNDFRKKIKEKIDLINFVKTKSNGDDETKTIKFPSDTFGWITIPNIKYPETNEEITEILFNLKPEGKSTTFGKGEVLISTYYSDVKRLKYKSHGGESGDCAIYIGEDSDEEPKINRYIEVKSSNTQFFTLKCYDENSNQDEIFNKFTKSNLNPKNITIDTKQVEENSESEETLNDSNINFDEKDTLPDDIIDHPEKIKDDVKLKIVKNCIGGMATYLLKEKNKKSGTPLSLVFFNAHKGKKGYTFKHMDVSDDLSKICKQLCNGIDEFIIHVPKRRDKSKQTTYNKFRCSLTRNKMYLYIL